jgi:hypothetical protein
MSKTRASLATAIILAIVLSPLIAPATWTDGHEKTATASPETDRRTTHSTRSDAKESPSPAAVESELSRLRPRLNVQRAVLASRQFRIAELEAQLHISTVEPEISSTGSTAAPPAISVVSQLAAGLVSPIAVQSGGPAEKAFKLGPVRT